MKNARTSTPWRATGAVAGAGQNSPLVGLPTDAFDDRIAIVGTAGSGKTYAAKGFVERLLESGARVAIVDPLGAWWGLRASADGSAPWLSLWSCSVAGMPTSRSQSTPPPRSGKSSPTKRSPVS